MSGVVIAVVLYLAGGAIALFVMRGIPLGSAGLPSSETDQLVHLALAAGAGLVGGAAAVRIGRFRPFVHAVTVAVLLAVIALVAFANPVSRWPLWFGPALAGAAALGALIGIIFRR